MKYGSLLLIFLVGILIGRWSILITRNEIVRPPETSSHELVQSESANLALRESAKTPIASNGTVADQKRPAAQQVDPAHGEFLRTDSKVREKQIQDTFNALMEARQKGDVEEQNRLFSELEKQDPKHEKVFQAKAMFLQDDENWDGARDMLKECVTFLPRSLFCHRRLANIRSNTIDEKLRYGTQCLQISKNDPLCTVDVAIALQSKGEFEKARIYFEQALKMAPRGEGYNREYILFHYAATLESLHMDQKSKETYAEACRLNMKPACEKLKS